VPARDLARRSRERCLPLTPGEGVEVRLTWSELVTDPRRRAGGWARLHRRRRLRLQWRVRDTRTRTRSRPEVPLDRELRVAVDHDASGNAELFRKDAARRKSRSGAKPARADRVAKLALQLPTQRSAWGELQMEGYWSHHTAVTVCISPDHLEGLARALRKRPVVAEAAAIVVSAAQSLHALAVSEGALSRHESVSSRPLRS